MTTTTNHFSDPRDQRYHQHLTLRGLVFENPIKGGANYDVCVEHNGILYVSGMVPRVQGIIAGTGRVGETQTLEGAQRAAEVCILRGLGIVQQQIGSLSLIEKILKVTAFTQSAADFTQQSEVADAASTLLYEIFAPHGQHTRTSVGVYQLPKNACVEIDMIVALKNTPS
ncbi:RidA family protein [Parvibium lacunae]|uniref:RidA family protein n=1 Tax=Parvibium lacunae TaxID=1888893 RepID=A0A368L195_9BURK|nr:RidA family protein [Parvibium lacunae]RCS57339.1 RidA family protein [Parvibium lacunae]